MNDELLESLLREDESSYLDFKREQYRFYGASDSDKAKLLKDVLAFANAWRRTTAYILIGVEDVVGSRSRILGVTGHLKDSDLQQFVNSKTQRPIILSYAAYPAEGQQVGIIEIPVQRRPFYLNTGFAGLKPKVVYVRRGSSTAEADPDEIAGMGVLTGEPSGAIPTLSLQFVDLTTRRPLGTQIRVRSRSLEPLPVEKIKPLQDPMFPVLDLIHSNPYYYEDLIQYVIDKHELVALGFVVENTGPVPGYSVSLKARIPKMQGFRVTDVAPEKPSRSDLLRAGSLRPVTAGGPQPDLEEIVDYWELTIPFGNVLPRSQVWCTDPVFIGAERPLSVHFTAQLFAENLPQPLEEGLQIEIEGERRPMTVEDVRPILED